MVYFSFIGNHDIFNSASKSFGPAVNIFNSYKDRIKHVFFFVTPNSQKFDYSKIANENANYIKSINPKIQIELINIKIDNPIDYDLIYPLMLDEALRVVEENNLEQDEKIINISSGTPTMTSCWVLLSQSGLIKNAKLVQSFEQKFARDGKTVLEVNLTIDDFPKITAPSSLKRKLTILERRNKELENQLFIDTLDKEFPSLIGQSKNLLEVKDQIFHDIDTRTHILIIGERGTGKEVVAKSIWKKYHKTEDTSLITFDCGSFSSNLIESELFGHIKGAFTGADSDKKGIFEIYSDRMIFLDEIGNLSIESQSKLLRVLANGEFRRLGDPKIMKTSSQIIAATNKDIYDSTIFAQDIKDRFDETILLPPLRKRKEDIPILIEHFLTVYSSSENLSNPLWFDEELIDKLSNNEWDSNIRGLEKFIKRVIRRFGKGGLVKLSGLPDRFINSILDDDSLDLILPQLPLPVPLDEYKKLIVEKARSIANTHSEVDKLLNQKDGTERQRKFRKNKI